MSAASQTAPDKGQEPSMEEILASIRRIIADDQADKPEAGQPVPQPQNDDVLDLAELTQAVRPQPASPRSVEPAPKPSAPPFALPDLGMAGDEIAFAEPAASPRQETRHDTRQDPRQDPRIDPRETLAASVEREAVDRLTSRTTDDHVGQTFQLLSRTVLSQNARTLEDLVVEMLRPMLKDWLDDHLPSMVERLVRAEIERVARGR